VARVWNFDGVRKDEWIQPSLSANLKAQTNIWTSYLYSNERFANKDFDSIQRFMLNVNSNFSDPLRVGFWLSHGRFIARGLDDPVLGDGTEFILWGTIKPLQRFIIQPEYSYFTLDHPDNGPNIFSGYILRTRINYQFTRELFLRLIIQYDDFDDELDIEPLLTYKLNPFTVFHFGSTHDYRDLDGSGFTQTSRQFFLKFQYLFRI